MVLGLLVVSYFRLSPVETARERCLQAGWKEEEIFWTRTSRTNWPILRRGQVDFVAPRKTPPVKITVNLEQPVFFLGWRVTDYGEVAQK